MKITKPEHLDKLDKDGLIAFLKSDREDKIALWNAWCVPKYSAPVRIDLKEATLMRANLEGADLGSTNLERAKLVWANLTGVDLAKGILVGADLRGATLEGANLIGANLEEADLSNADMKRANLYMANLEGANLCGAHLEEANLVEAHLEGTELVEANLEKTHLVGAYLEGANLGAAHLEGAELGGACLEGADLILANLSGAILDDTTLDGADLGLARLRDVALSPVASLHGVHLYQTYFWGILSLRYEQFLDERGHSTIWEDTEGRFSEAKDVYKSLKGYFEDAGDYEGANWAFGREQVMEKWMVAPRPLRWLYPRWRGKWQGGFCAPNLARWLGLELSDKLAGYGLSLWRPLFALAAVVLLFTLVYWAFGMITSTPGCSYAELAQQWRAGCAPTHNLLDALLFSLGALTSTEIGAVRPYLSHVGLLMTLEVLLGIALTGLFGFVLGNKLRYS